MTRLTRLTRLIGRTARHMRSRGRWMGADAGAAPITAEGATLPVIRAAGFEARVNAYIVGETRRAAGASTYPYSSAASPVSPASPSAAPPHAVHAVSGPSGQNQSTERDKSPGCQGAAADLWYLSLVGARGQGTTLRALWANLVSNRARSVWLEGVGSVALGQHRLDLAQLGYPIHWNYRQAVVTPGREIQGILEADALTCYDPLLMPETTRRRGRPAGDATSANGVSGPAGRTGKGRHGRAEEAAVTLSTQSSGGTTGPSGGDGVDEAAAREAHPLFLLLVRGDEMRLQADAFDAGQAGWEAATDQLTILAKQHLRFLSTRIGWLPYYPRWAAYLWERARERGEAERLRTWCYSAPSAPSPALSDGNRCEGNAFAGSTPHAHPLLVGAYLCRPDPLALTADLQRAIQSGVFDRRTPLTESTASRTGAPGASGTPDRPEPDVAA